MSYQNPNLGFGQQPSYPPNPGYPGASQATPGYPPNQGFSGYPPGGQAAAPGYPPAQGGYPAYPPQQSAPGYPPAPGGAPGYPATPGYPPAPGGAPGYPPAPGGAPGYPAAPGYPPAPGGCAAPGYQPAAGGAPGYPGAPAAAPGYPSNPGYAPGTPGQGHPAAAGYPGHGVAHGGADAAYSASSFPADQPTIRFLANFDPSMDASLLRKAMKGFGTDETSIINVLANRTSEQRQRIILTYQQAYGKDLIKDLMSELGSNLERVVLAMMVPTTILLADSLHEAMKGFGTNEDTLVEILCTRNNREIYEVKMAYQSKYGHPLQKGLEGETSGHFRRLLISMSTGARDEGNVNFQLAPQLAQQLYKAGAAKAGTDESEFNRILASYSFPLLRAVFEEYKKIKGKSLCDAIKSEFSGDIQNGLLAVCMSIENRPLFYAKCLQDAMRGMGTKDDALIRLVVTRAEIDLGNIKQEFQRMYGKSLESQIKSETSGDYKKMLIALADG